MYIFATQQKIWKYNRTGSLWSLELNWPNTSFYLKHSLSPSTGFLVSVSPTSSTTSFLMKFHISMNQ